MSGRRIGRAADHQQALDFGANEFLDLESDALEDVGGVDRVIDTEVGYTSGWLANPRYEYTHDSESGHAEAVRVTFDPSVLSY